MTAGRLLLVWLLLAAGVAWHVERTVEAYRRAEPFRAAVDHVAWSDRLQEVVGEDLAPVGVPLGRFDDRNADLRFRVEGARGTAEVDLEMRRVDDLWRVIAARWSSGEDGGALETEDDADIRRGSDHAVRAWAMYQNGHLYDALEEFGRALAADPGNARSHHWRGWVHHDLGELDAARADFERAVDLGPGHDGAHYGLGLVLGRLGDYPGSARHLDRSIELDSTSGVAFYARAVTRSRLGDGAGARDDLQRACALDYEDACEAAPPAVAGGGA